MKRNLLTFKLVVGLVWVVCLGIIGVGMLLSGGTHSVALVQAERALAESQEKLAFAQSAGKEETKQRTLDRLTQTRESLYTFTCPNAAESALIFRIGQMANTLELKKFTSRVPETVPDKTLEKTERLTEGWLAVDFAADYLKTAAFVNALERHEPVLFVESITLRRSDENPQEATVRMLISYLIQSPEKSRATANADLARQITQ